MKEHLPRHLLVKESVEDTARALVAAVDVPAVDTVTDSADSLELPVVSIL